jgi:hypothetical protein
MSEALIASLQQRVTDLQAENGRLKAESIERRKRLKALTEEHATLQDVVTDLTRERDDWKAKAEAAPGQQSEEIRRLTRELTERDHLDAFRSLYGQEFEAGEGDDKQKFKLNDKVAVGKLMSLIGHKAEGPPDAEKIKAAVLAARESDPYLFSPLEVATASSDPRGSQTLPTKPAGPGLNRGANASGEAQKQTVAQQMDAVFARTGRTDPFKL